MEEELELCPNCRKFVEIEGKLNAQGIYNTCPECSENTINRHTFYFPPLTIMNKIFDKCVEIETISPQRRASYQVSFKSIDKNLRDDIVFWSSGWGWRLRKNWRENWYKKCAELAQIIHSQSQ